jgi:ubiquinone/menaquinone biosynthesis C-methylase UbiE
MRWVLFLPRTFQTPDRLKAILRPRPGERLLEVGPGVGIHALPVAAALAPDGVLHVLDVQRGMLKDLVVRPATGGVHNVRPYVGDARRLPYPDHSFDGAYLISVLGEIADQPAALCELARVLRPAGRLVVGEIVVDPDFISIGELRKRLERAGFSFERRLGPGFAYLAAFRSGAVDGAANRTTSGCGERPERGSLVATATWL